MNSTVTVDPIELFFSRAINFSHMKNELKNKLSTYEKNKIIVVTLLVIVAYRIPREWLEKP